MGGACTVGSGVCIYGGGTCIFGDGACTSVGKDVLLRSFCINSVHVIITITGNVKNMLC